MKQSTISDEKTAQAQKIAHGAPQQTKRKQLGLERTKSLIIAAIKVWEFRHGYR